MELAREKEWEDVGPHELPDRGGAGYGADDEARGLEEQRSRSAPAREGTREAGDVFSQEGGTGRLQGAIRQRPDRARNTHGGSFSAMARRQSPWPSEKGVATTPDGQ